MGTGLSWHDGVGLGNDVSDREGVSGGEMRELRAQRAIGLKQWSI